MKVFKNANWIRHNSELEGGRCPVFKKDFKTDKEIKSAVLSISAHGVYEATINSKRVGEYILAPGWTTYKKRLQYQTYNVKELLEDNNSLEITVGEGWAVGRLTFNWFFKIFNDFPALICELVIEYTDGTMQTIISDDSFTCALSPFLYSGIYDGEIFDANIKPDKWENVTVEDYSKDNLIPQEGDEIKEIERINAIEFIITPAGERVIDFGQNITGYVEFSINAKKGDVVEYTHAEILDKDGNFYTENLRTAKQEIKYICKDGEQSYKPHFTFQGFRYIRLNSYPEAVDLSNFTAIVVHSDMKRTGYFECSNPKINKLFKNIIYGQKGNYLDVPTDCPQRDERLGWTGDAQVFVRAGSYNFDVNRFFKKWLRDLAADQKSDGTIPAVSPDCLNEDHSNGSPAWGDAAVICPWQIYLTYADSELLAEQFDSMEKWVSFIKNENDNMYLRTGDYHSFGDWLGLDNGDSVFGATDRELIGSAYYAYVTQLLIKSGKALNKDVGEYEELHKKIVAAFKEAYIKDGVSISNTQTANALILYFELCDNKEQIAANLAKLVKDNGNKLTTGFVGTPYLLHALNDNGYTDLAYSLLLQEEYPSWLYSVNLGATTIWEHWDGYKADGSFWSKDMNSFNHYAYGAVADFMYGVMAGINTDENNPGFKHIIFKPVTDDRISYVTSSIETKYGTVGSKWMRNNGKVSYTFDVPANCTATVILNGNSTEIKEGRHTF